MHSASRKPRDSLRILLLASSFNSLAQRVFCELGERGHQLSVELATSIPAMDEAARAYQPDLIIAPFLKCAIPESVWRRYVCLVVHPGIPGDRGPSALDWAILENEPDWGVTVLQAEAEMDAGPVWAWRGFPMRPATKSSLYRFEVADAAVAAVLEAVDRYRDGDFPEERLPYGMTERQGQWRDAMRQADRRIDWNRDDTGTVLRKIQTGDGRPGVLDELLGLPCRLFDPHVEGALTGRPGEILARRNDAVCVATRDGALWLGHLQPELPDMPHFKLPATRVLADRLEGVPELSISPTDAVHTLTHRNLLYEERGSVGIIHFDFYNGAMSTERCRRLLGLYRYACRRPTKLIVLINDGDLWSNGIDLNAIEASADPAEASWRNVLALNDLVEAIIRTTSHVTVAAVSGNAGAGGVFLALAADRVYARQGVILNPHYRTMGGLHGSEYWTYLLPRRAGAHQASQLVERCLPMGVEEAVRLGLVDIAGSPEVFAFREEVRDAAASLTGERRLSRMLADKRRRLKTDEAHKPLTEYRAEELEKMRESLFGEDRGYHEARSRFVHRTPLDATPAHLVSHDDRDDSLPAAGATPA